MAALQAKTIQIRILCGGKSLRAFWISLQRDGAISIGCADQQFQVTLRAAPGAPDELQKIVRDPHVTFHPPHYFHLTGNRNRKGKRRDAEILGALTWGSQIQLGGEPQLWLVFGTSPIRELSPQTGGSKKNIIDWPVNCDDDTKSVVLYVDFATTTHMAGNTDARSKFVEWGGTILRFQVAIIEGHGPALDIRTWG